VKLYEAFWDALQSHIPTTLRPTKEHWIFAYFIHGPNSLLFTFKIMIFFHNCFTALGTESIKPMSSVISSIYIKMWVFHILMCLGRDWRHIHGGNRLSRDWWGGKSHYKNLNVICIKKAFISLVIHIVRWRRHLWHKTTPILH
jgi:hypothetical protein